MKIALFTSAREKLLSNVLSISRQHSDDVVLVRGTDDLCPDKLADRHIVSIFNAHIIPEQFLSRPNINIHAGPTWYPGWGGIWRAHLDSRTTHGVCAHHMERTVDSGKIVYTDCFPIDLNVIDLTALSELTRVKSLNALDAILEHVSLFSRLAPETGHWSGVRWSRQRLLQSLKQHDSAPKSREAMDVYFGNGQF